MSDNKLFRSIETLNFSAQTLEKLKLSGINNLEDFNTFSLDELRVLLQETFLEILPTLKQFALPRDLRNLNLNDDVIKKLTLLGVNDFEQLLNTEINTLNQNFDLDYDSWKK